MKAIKLAVVAEYSDVLQRSSSCTDESVAQSLILQMKAEDWDGVFSDVSDSDVIPDKAVVRVVEECPMVPYHACSRVCGCQLCTMILL